MTRELYQSIKNHKEDYPEEIVALAGFCATYNAKWFGGYAGTIKTKIGTYRNYYDEAVRNVLKQVESIRAVQFTHGDFFYLRPKNTLIYCDPPYEGTTGYSGNFDHELYWQHIRELSKDNIVLCSEYAAPSDFKCIWQKELTTTLDKNSRSKSCEKLFTLNKGEKQCQVQ